jgi:hypothetical protein
MIKQDSVEGQASRADERYLLLLHNKVLFVSFNNYICESRFRYSRLTFLYNLYLMSKVHFKLLTKEIDGLSG